MSGPGYRLTEAAADDTRDILKASARQFGPLQRERYAKLLIRAAEMLAQDPERPGSWNRNDLREGVRSFHVEHAAGRRGAASHILYYLTRHLDDGSNTIVIVRILHERMQPAHHLPETFDF
ncbi:type II toxin-antitoxin system RelE/ParE family toxin [Skermanella mucosa]|uniref:type II toxin-antitoxin system RelE/ParE family toxin n=1 Tax=Skermanella mucosa TaxID=1789672 RepID=UPI00192B09EF|nr:type II toxin-antitoxin system RelE/ParE family toxin [Skermanella mucosa]